MFEDEMNHMLHIMFRLHDNSFSYKHQGENRSPSDKFSDIKLLLWVSSLINSKKHVFIFCKYTKETTLPLYFTFDDSSYQHLNHKSNVLVFNNLSYHTFFE